MSDVLEPNPTHSPLPWRVSSLRKDCIQTGGHPSYILDDEQSSNKEADAAFICLAVNNHAALVGAASALLESINGVRIDDAVYAEEINRTFFLMRKTLAAAQGTSWQN